MHYQETEKFTLRSYRVKAASIDCDFSGILPESSEKYERLLFETLVFKYVCAFLFPNNGSDFAFMDSGSLFS